MRSGSATVKKSCSRSSTGPLLPVGTLYKLAAFPIHQVEMVSVTWRSKTYIVEMNRSAALKDLGNELCKLTGAKPDTIRLIIPSVDKKGSKLFYPFSDEHSLLILQEVYDIEGKSIRMMGVCQDEMDSVLQSSKVNLRIPGFEEEDRRMKLLSANTPPTFTLPEGPFIFSEFSTLTIPGIKLDPPASEALKRMHMLASDPGIVAIMKKHRWHVALLSEMAPVGYVGVTPKCFLGLNKNFGEEISLRLRTDDLKGFRKFESIKKTLLHELAHMVHSEHDANFYALDKQLNEEVIRLDWSKSRPCRLTGTAYSGHAGANSRALDNTGFSQKLGGNVQNQLKSARESAVAAAVLRHTNELKEQSSANSDLFLSFSDAEPDPDDCAEPHKRLSVKTYDLIEEPDPDDSL